MKDKTSKGLGIVVKKAQIITGSEEELLWENGFLGSSNPKQFVNTLLYLFGLNNNTNGFNITLNINVKFLRYTEVFQSVLEEELNTRI